MKDTPIQKVALIFIITILLWIASFFVRNISEERRGRRSEVIQEISSSLTPNQKLGAPYISVPYRETYKDDGKVQSVETANKIVYAQKAEFGGEAKVESRSRGIFRAQTYDLTIKGKAKFELPTEAELRPYSSYSGGKVAAQEPRLVLPFAARKGLKSMPVVKVGGMAKPLKAEPCGTDLCFPFGVPYQQLEISTVEFSYEIAGMDQLDFLTSAQETQITLSANWPSPSFRGEFLPNSRELRNDGFSAEWNLVGALDQDRSFGLKFMEPVDVYTLTDRATKYAILFILSVFGGFFLVETASRMRLHPLQYGMVGAALLMFYLLVLSLAEHISFGFAYAAAMAASLSLIWFYLAAAFRDARRSNYMGAFLGALYGALYVIIAAEDFALLFGTLLTFSLLAAIMVATRKYDWYAMTEVK